MSHPLDGADEIAAIDEAAAQADQKLLAQARDQALMDGYRQASGFLETLRELGVHTNHYFKAKRGLDDGFAQALRITALQD
jgi:hypothetical protein